MTSLSGMTCITQFGFFIMERENIFPFLATAYYSICAIVFYMMGPRDDVEYAAVVQFLSNLSLTAFFSFMSLHTENRIEDKLEEELEKSNMLSKLKSSKIFFFLQFFLKNINNLK
jgi:hypothetical protein